MWEPEHMPDGWPWASFADDAKDVAARVKSVIEAAGFVYLGTLRRDGSPRISPVEAHFVGDELTLVMIPKTHKARDVIGDPRVVLQSPIVNAGDPGTECKLRGRAVIVQDQALRDAAARQIEAASGWRPGPSWLFLAVRIEQVALLDWENGDLTLLRWDQSSGIRPPERRQLDLERGEYTRA
jgi:hypothetical protein